MNTRLAMSIWAVLLLAGCTAGSVSQNECTAEPETEQAAAAKAIARRWFEDVINQRNLDAIADIYAADYVYHGLDGTELRGPEAVRRFAAAILAASSDRRAVVEQQVAEGDLVVTRFSSTGHHTGVFRGVEPTGDLWTTTGIDISRIENGRIVEDWEVIHNSGLGPGKEDVQTP